MINVHFLILLFLIPILKLSTIHQLIILLAELFSLSIVVIFHKHILNYFGYFIDGFKKIK